MIGGTARLQQGGAPLIGILIPLMLVAGSALPAGGGAAPAPVTTVAGPAKAPTGDP